MRGSMAVMLAPRKSFWLPDVLLVDHADMGGDHMPAVGKPDPGLHLPADLARHGWAMAQRGGHGAVPAVGGDDSSRDGAGEADRRARGAKRRDLVVAVQDFGAAVAAGAPTSVAGRL